MMVRTVLLFLIDVLIRKESEAGTVECPSEVFIPSGENGIISCNYQYNKSINNFEWALNGTSIASESTNFSSKYLVREDGALIIISATKEHHGTYTLFIYADEYFNPSEIKVTVGEPSEIVQCPQTQEITVGAVLNISCTFHRAELVKSFYWEKDNTKIDSNSSDYKVFQNGDLYKKEAQLLDSGNYSLFVAFLQRESTEVSTTCVIVRGQTEGSNILVGGIIAVISLIALLLILVICISRRWKGWKYIVPDKEKLGHPQPLTMKGIGSPEVNPDTETPEDPDGFTDSFASNPGQQQFKRVP